MYRSEPDYVSGRKGHFEIVPWINHPAFCVCDVCPKFREREAARTGKPLADVWAAPLPIRIRRVSPYPDNRKASAAAVLALKAEEEKRLLDALEQADAEKRARRNAVSFGMVVFRSVVLLLRRDEVRAVSSAAEWLADGGCNSLNNVDKMVARGCKIFAPLRRRRSGRNPEEIRPTDSEAVKQWRQRMTTDEAKQIYKERRSDGGVGQRAMSSPRSVAVPGAGSEKSASGGPDAGNHE